MDFSASVIERASADLLCEEVGLASGEGVVDALTRYTHERRDVVSASLWHLYSFHTSEILCRFIAVSNETRCKFRKDISPMQEKEQEISIFKSRILEYLAKVGMKPAEFYRISGITRGVLKQPNGLSEDNVLKFFKCFPEADPVWFITGAEGARRDISPMQEKEQESNQIDCPSDLLDKSESLKEEVARLKEDKMKLLEQIVELQGRIIGK